MLKMYLRQFKINKCEQLNGENYKENELFVQHSLNNRRASTWKRKRIVPVEVVMICTQTRTYVVILHVVRL